METNKKDVLKSGHEEEEKKKRKRKRTEREKQQNGTPQTPVQNKFRWGKDKRAQERKQNRKTSNPERKEKKKKEKKIPHREMHDTLKSELERNPLSMQVWKHPLMKKK